MQFVISRCFVPYGEIFYVHKRVFGEELILASDKILARLKRR